MTLRCTYPAIQSSCLYFDRLISIVTSRIVTSLEHVENKYFLVHFLVFAQRVTLLIRHSFSESSERRQCEDFFWVTIESVFGRLLFQLSSLGLRFGAGTNVARFQVAKTCEG